MRIGNPYSAIFSGIKTNVKWGLAFDNKEAEKNANYYETWEKALKEKEENLTNELSPATWNIITLILTPAKPDDLGYIEFSMTVDQVKLIRSRK